MESLRSGESRAIAVNIANRTMFTNTSNQVISDIYSHINKETSNL
jgi:hypothetical protein